MDDDSYCHTFDFLIGVIFCDTTSAFPLFELISTYGMDQLNNLAYNISADAIERTLSDDERMAAYSFCVLSFGPCNVSQDMDTVYRAVYACVLVLVAHEYGSYFNADNS